MLAGTDLKSGSIDFNAESTTTAENNVNKQQAQEQAQIPGSEQAAAHKWHWNEKVGGEGDRPDWFKERYKTVEDQARAYDTLEKKFGGFVGAPESYTYEGFDETGLKLDGEHPLTKGFLDVAKKSNMNQATFNELSKLFGQFVNDLRPPSKEQVLKDLGDEGPRMLTNLSNWAGNIFTKEEMSDLSREVKSPALIKLLNKIRLHATNSQTINNMPKPGKVTEHSGQRVRTKQEIESEIIQNFAKFTHNGGENDYRKSILQELEQVMR